MTKKHKNYYHPGFNESNPSFFFGHVANIKIDRQVKILLADSRFRQEINRIRIKHKNLVAGWRALKWEVDPWLVDGERKVKSASDTRKLYEMIIFDLAPLADDCLRIVKLYDLKPQDFWAKATAFYILEGVFQGIYWIFGNEPLEKKLGIQYRQTSDYFHANCEVKIITTPLGEKKISIDIADDTTIEDVKSVWSDVKKAQEDLKNERGKKQKHNYPRKNLLNAVRLRELDKKLSSDWEKQEELFGAAPRDPLAAGKVESKRKNNVRQIRHRYKKTIH